MKAAILTLAILSSGCSPSQPGAPRATRDVTPSYVRYDLPSSDAYEFSLEDGTRCVSHYSSITCEWKHAQ